MWATEAPIQTVCVHGIHTKTQRRRVRDARSAGDRSCLFVYGGPPPSPVYAVGGIRVPESTLCLVGWKWGQLYGCLLRAVYIRTSYSGEPSMRALVWSYSQHACIKLPHNPLINTRSTSCDRERNKAAACLIYKRWQFLLRQDKKQYHHHSSFITCQSLPNNKSFPIQLLRQNEVRRCRHSFRCCRLGRCHLQRLRLQRWLRSPQHGVPVSTAYKISRFVSRC